jgi:rod shape determining protein RodA
MTGSAITQPRARRVPRLPWRRVRTFDWPLLVAVIACQLAGLAMIYSATKRMEVSAAWEDLVVKQVVFAVVGLAVMLLVTLTEYRVLVALWVWIYAAVVAAHLALLTYGSVFGGAQRWFNVGFIAIQPSEISKIALIIVLAAYFERHPAENLRHVLVSLGMTGVLMFLVLLEPNLSTALLLGAIWLGIVFAAGIRLLHLSLLALLIAPLTYLALKSNFLYDYMLKRIATWLNPNVDPADMGYQSIQTLIAVGNGGLWGRGFASGSQTQGGWLPLMYTDSIYALVSEELGFIGAALFLAMLAFIIWRVLRAGSIAQDFAGSLICVGVAAYLLTQTFVNVAVVLQLLPVTGLSLPLISYGGSSVIAVMMGIGLVQSVLIRRKPLEFG